MLLKVPSQEVEVDRQPAALSQDVLFAARGGVLVQGQVAGLQLVEPSLVVPGNRAIERAADRGRAAPEEGGTRKSQPPAAVQRPAVALCVPPAQRGLVELQAALAQSAGPTRPGPEAAVGTRVQAEIDPLWILAPLHRQGGDGPAEGGVTLEGVGPSKGWHPVGQAQLEGGGLLARCGLGFCRLFAGLGGSDRRDQQNGESDKTKPLDASHRTLPMRTKSEPGAKHTDHRYRRSPSCQEEGSANGQEASPGSALGRTH